MERIYYLEMEIVTLKNELKSKEQELENLKRKQMQVENSHSAPYNAPFELSLNNSPKLAGLPKWAIERYSRQILLPDISVEGQEKLCAAKVLVVGAGGLGCPAALYLAGAGIGEIDIVDGDVVDITNIHRQILHGERDQNVNKAVSAARSLQNINSRIKVVAHEQQVSTLSVLGLMEGCDVVLDCTDNVPTRYLLGDACAMLKIPLVSGSALKMEGQLSVYSYQADRNSKEKDASLVGPCYRCVFPTPPPPETVGSCSAHGVAGPVPGMIGCLQALEAIKLIAGQPHDKLLVGRMLLFDGEDMTLRTVKLRPRNPNCKGCSGEPRIDNNSTDYAIFCTGRATEESPELDILLPTQRITAKKLATQLRSQSDKQRHLLVDVRSEEEYRMCHVAGTDNWPIDKLHGERLGGLVEKIRGSDQVTFICRRGNDSQLAVERALRALEEPHRPKVRDLVGGLHAWAAAVDPNFPVY